MSLGIIGHTEAFEFCYASEDTGQGAHLHNCAFNYSPAARVGKIPLRLCRPVVLLEDSLHLSCILQRCFRQQIGILQTSSSVLGASKVWDFKCSVCVLVLQRQMLGFNLDTQDVVSDKKSCTLSD